MLKKIRRQFQVLQMGHPLEQHFAKNSIFKGESHNFIEMVLVVDGQVEISEDEKVYILGKRDLIIHNAMEFHSIKSARSTEPHFYNLSFIAGGNLPERLFEGVFHLREEQTEAFLYIFYHTKEFIQGEMPSPLAAQRSADALSSFLLELCESQPVSPFSTGSGALLFKKLVRDMQRSVYRNLTLEELAEQNHISISYIKKLFNQYASISPKQYFSALRAKEAAHLLAKGLSSAQVSERMDFSSPNYFTLFFKKQMGLTPSSYKNQRL